MSKPKIMKKQRVIIILSLLLAFIIVKAQVSVIPSKIKEVTVYPFGANVVREVAVTKLGNYTLSLDKLPKHLDAKSIQVFGYSGAHILSVRSKVESNISSKSESKLDSLLTKKQTLSDSLQLITAFIEVLVAEEEIIDSNSDLSSDNNSPNVAEVIELSKYYNQRISQIKKSIFDYKMTYRSLELRLQNLNEWESNYLDNIYEEHMSVEIDISANKPGIIRISYFLSGAKWEPYYDLKTTKSDSSLLLVRKAMIQQNTGEDWNEAIITLTNAEPQKDKRLPVLSPHYLGFKTKRYKQNYVTVAPADQDIHGTVIDEEGLPMIGANVIVIGTTVGTVTDIDGRFSLPKRFLGRKISITYTGFSSVEHEVSSSHNIVILKEGVQLSESVLTSQLSGLSLKRL